MFHGKVVIIFFGVLCFFLSGCLGSNGKNGGNQEFDVGENADPNPCFTGHVDEGILDDPRNCIDDADGDFDYTEIEPGPVDAESLQVVHLVDDGGSMLSVVRVNEAGDTVFIESDRVGGLNLDAESDQGAHLLSAPLGGTSQGSHVIRKARFEGATAQGAPVTTTTHFDDLGRPKRVEHDAFRITLDRVGQAEALIDLSDGEGTPVESGINPRNS